MSLLTLRPSTIYHIFQTILPNCIAYISTYRVFTNIFDSNLYGTFYDFYITSLLIQIVFKSVPTYFP